MPKVLDSSVENYRYIIFLMLHIDELLKTCHSLLSSNAAIYSFREKSSAFAGVGELHRLFRSCNCFLQ